jgi:preprotein translocase subunit SecG
MILIILVQRPQGGGLASAFGGAGGGGTDTVFGGRVGDALTVMTVIAFILFLGLAVSLNLVDSAPLAQDATATSTSSVVSPNTATTDTTITPKTPDHPTSPSSSDHPTGGNK